MKTPQQAKWIRTFRWLHRKLAIALFVFFLIISLTGILLGMKKQTGLQAPTANGFSTEPTAWLPLDSLYSIALKVLSDSVSPELSSKLDRIDIRPEKGIAKFVFKEHYWGMQLDCTTGQLLSLEKRGSDIIEHLHDGSLVDRWLGTGDGFKIGYTLITGLSLLMLILSGLWLWYGPKKLRQAKKAK